MAELFRMGAIVHAIERVAVGGVTRSEGALTVLAIAVERKAKENAGEGGVHARGTKTPATPGRGPAVISGDLRRSITHAKDGPLHVRVGPASIPHRSYGRSRGTTSGKIGLYLETGRHRGGTKYPFLLPAARSAGATTARAAWAGYFTGGWRVNL